MYDAVLCAVLCDAVMPCDAVCCVLCDAVLCDAVCCVHNQSHHIRVVDFHAPLFEEMLSNYIICNVMQCNDAT